MKKLLAAVVAIILSLAAVAEWRPVGTIQLADNVTLAQGVSKLGAFTGNAMLGILAAGVINDLPGASVFGPGRKGAATLYPFFVENGKYEFAILYPVAITKAAFLKKFPDAVESNRLIRVKCAVMGSTPEINYVAFSADGNWAGISDNPQQARLALAETKTAAKSLDGDMVKVRIVRRGLDEYIKGGEQEKDLRTRDIISQLDGLTFGVRVSERGLDFRGSLKTIAGTEVAKVGQHSLAVNPLVFAGKDSIYCSAEAEGCGQESPAKIWKEFSPLLEQAGLKLDWIEFAEQNGNTKFTIDLVRFFDTVKAMLGTKNPDEQSAAAIEEYVSNHNKDKKFKAVGPAVNCEIAFKGYAGKFKPAQRFSYTLPEAADKRPFAVGFFSLYSLLRLAMPVIVQTDPTAFRGFDTVIAALPEEGQGGMAFMAWTEKNSLRFFFRIGADEFKAVSAGFAAFAAISTNGGKSPANAGGKTSGDSRD